ncbi:family 16 glycosylhydrolase [Pendulispora albinea]|uniref:Glycoside hydrolase family 16 protein n=1 Tax=Pendulispora albinea TaxID=2741071 RepID=A0ABZ2M642_9BACT
MVRRSVVSRVLRAFRGLRGLRALRAGAVAAGAYAVAAALSHCYWLTPYDDLTSDGAGGDGGDAGAIAYPPGGGWRLVFDDEFEGRTLDRRKWDTKYPRDGERAYSDPDNGEAQWYLEQNAIVEDGKLKLTARREEYRSPSRVFRYTSGMVHAKSSPFQYGYMEARMLLPKGVGFHPSFWTWPEDENASPEIDVMSFFSGTPSKISCIYHPPGGGSTVGTDVTRADWSDGWHTFAADWSRDGVNWYIDGQWVHSSPAPSTKLYMILTMAVTNGAAGFPPAPDGNTTFPSALQIDYVRVFQR